MPYMATRARTGLGDKGLFVAVGVAVVVHELVGVDVCDAVLEGDAVDDAVLVAEGVSVLLLDTDAP